MADIFHVVSIKAKAEDVYKAITEQEGLINWMLEGSVGEIVAKPELGFVNEFRFGKLFVNKMKIIQLELNKTVEWECVNEDKNDEWSGTNFIFVLDENKPYTKLKFWHKGLKEENDFWGECNYHWGRSLSLLKDYCEKKQEEPKK